MLEAPAVGVNGLWLCRCASGISAAALAATRDGASVDGNLFPRPTLACGPASSHCFNKREFPHPAEDTICLGEQLTRLALPVLRQGMFFPAVQTAAECLLCCHQQSGEQFKVRRCCASMILRKSNRGVRECFTRGNDVLFRDSSCLDHSNLVGPPGFEPGTNGL